MPAFAGKFLIISWIFCSQTAINKTKEQLITTITVIMVRPKANERTFQLNVFDAIMLVPFLTAQFIEHMLNNTTLYNETTSK